MVLYPLKKPAFAGFLYTIYVNLRFGIAAVLGQRDALLAQRAFLRFVCFGCCPQTAKERDFQIDTRR
jgi:hypothetical protein